MSQPTIVQPVVSQAPAYTGYPPVYTHVPVPVHVPSWSAVASQLRALVSRSPIITAAVVVAGAAAIAVGYTSSVQERRRRVQRRRIVRYTKSQFKTYRLDILKYISEQPWNHFSVAQLTQLYELFSALLSNPQRGVLPISALTAIIRSKGVDDEQVAHACARFFDLDGNWQVDFVEFIERLNVLQFAPRARKFDALFSVYDLDGSGRISRTELEQVIKAIGNRDPQAAKETAQRLLAAADGNLDGQLSRDDFLRLADGEHAGFSLWNDAVKQHFGLLH